MPESLRADSTWMYWLGRSYQAEDKAALAQQKFQSIVNQTNFYGQLALEELGTENYCRFLDSRF